MKPATGTFDALIAELASEQPLARAQARAALVEHGEAAVPALVAALKAPQASLRWEAAKALMEIGAPSAAPQLVEALEDTDAGVRWMAAEALIGLRHDGVKPLLQALTRRGDSVWLREGAHHILRTFEPPEWMYALAPVRAALEGEEPALTVPLAAERALQALYGPAG